MAYSTGISSSVNDVVTAAIAFAIANGWTAGSTWTSGAYTIKTISKNGIHFIFQYKVDELYLNTAKGIVGSGLATAQTNALSFSCRINPITGPHVGYHFFTDGTAIHCVVEVTTGSFTHFNFGEITKTGSWEGGAFVTGSNLYPYSVLAPSQLTIDANLCDFPFHTNNIGNSDGTNSQYASHLRVDALGTNRVHIFGAQLNLDAPHTCWCLTWGNNLGRPLISRGVNTFNGRAVILPIQIICSSSATNPPFYQLGIVPDCGLINTTNINPKDVVNTEWMIFPIGAKGVDASNSINSQFYGMAYKK